VAEARSVFDEGLHLAERVQEEAQKASLYTTWGLTLFARTSEWKEVLAYHIKAADIHRRLRRPARLYIDLVNMVEVWLLQENLDSAAEALREVAQIESESGPNHRGYFRRGILHMLLALRCGNLGERDAKLEEAERLLRQGVAVSNSHKDYEERASLDVALALCLARRRQQLDVEVTALLQGALEKTRDDDLAVRAHIIRTWGECLLQLSPIVNGPQWVDALDKFELALKLSTKANYAFEKAHAHLNIGLLLRGRKSDQSMVEMSREHLGLARELYTRLGIANPVHYL